MSKMLNIQKLQHPVRASMQIRKRKLSHSAVSPTLPPPQMLSSSSLSSSLDTVLSFATSCPAAWTRHHLFMLGYENVRFYAYQKLLPLTMQNGGGFLKTMVADLGSFVKQNWAHESAQIQIAFHNIPILRNLRIPDQKRFFVLIGGMMLSGHENHARRLTDDLLHMYMAQIQSDLTLEKKLGDPERQILRIASNYYRSCNINYRKLYDPRIGPRAIKIGDSSFSIDLPRLPQISSKQLLARALLHKELYPALVSPGHPVHENLIRSRIGLDASTAKVIRYDLSFLDGLGDLLIASESCHFLYRFRSLHPYSDDTTFGKKTFTMLKNILGTNTLLSRLAVCYNMHTALEDPTVYSLLKNSYIPQTLSLNSETDIDQAAYEEEFLADYFEQYLGALFLDSPEVAKEWLNLLFERILASISESYRVKFRRRNQFRFDYRAWSIDVIGRTI